MSKSVLISIQPYWVFLMIAKIMGWDIGIEKNIEVRKDFPKDIYWNKRTIIYCSKNRASFCLIPIKYQPFMERFLGKVIGEFVCDSVEMVNAGCSDYGIDLFYHDCMTKGCLTESEVDKYFNIPEDKDLRAMKGNGYAWHISQLKIYDKPKELSEFYPPILCSVYDKIPTKQELDIDLMIELPSPQYHKSFFCKKCKYYNGDFGTCDRGYKLKPITRAPQSWCYVEGE